MQPLLYVPVMDLEKRRAYQRQYRKRVYAERRAAFFADKVCVDCGATDDLHCDHRDPDEKIDHRVWTWTEKRRVAELAKCEVRCASCHRERHAVLRRSHGWSRYRAGCRCDVCRAANATRVRRWKEKKRSMGVGVAG